MPLDKAQQSNQLTSGAGVRGSLVGRFRTNAGADPTVVYTPGWAPTSLTLTGTGTYQLVVPFILTGDITGPRAGKRVICNLRADLQMGSANPGHANFGTVTNNANGTTTLVLFTFDNTNALANIASNVNNTVSFAIEWEELL
jgi:hypothetical protein